MVNIVEFNFLKFNSISFFAKLKQGIATSILSGVKMIENWNKV